MKLFVTLLPLIAVVYGYSGYYIMMYTAENCTGVFTITEKKLDVCYGTCSAQTFGGPWSCGSAAAKDVNLGGGLINSKRYQYADCTGTNGQGSMNMTLTLDQCANFNGVSMHATLSKPVVSKQNWLVKREYGPNFAGSKCNVTNGLTVVTNLDNAAKSTPSANSASAYCTIISSKRGLVECTSTGIKFTEYQYSNCTGSVVSTSILDGCASYCPGPDFSMNLQHVQFYCVNTDDPFASALMATPTPIIISSSSQVTTSLGLVGLLVLMVLLL